MNKKYILFLISGFCITMLNVHAMRTLCRKMLKVSIGPRLVTRRLATFRNMPRTSFGGTFGTFGAVMALACGTGVAQPEKGTGKTNTWTTAEEFEEQKRIAAIEHEAKLPERAKQYLEAFKAGNIIPEAGTVPEILKLMQDQTYSAETYKAIDEGFKNNDRNFNKIKVDVQFFNSLINRSRADAQKVTMLFMANIDKLDQSSLFGAYKILGNEASQGNVEAQKTLDECIPNLLKVVTLDSARSDLIMFNSLSNILGIISRQPKHDRLSH